MICVGVAGRWPRRSRRRWQPVALGRPHDAHVELLPAGQRRSGQRERRSSGLAAVLGEGSQFVRLVAGAHAVPVEGQCSSGLLEKLQVKVRSPLGHDQPRAGEKVRALRACWRPLWGEGGREVGRDSPRPRPSPSLSPTSEEAPPRASAPHALLAPRTGCLPRGTGRSPSGTRRSPRGDRAMPRGQGGRPLGQRAGPQEQGACPPGQRASPTGQRASPQGQDTHPGGQDARPGTQGLRPGDRTLGPGDRTLTSHQQLHWWDSVL